jgi:TatA/E family protein of Tat protein translocase
MELFGIGPAEFLIILVLGFIIIGPQKLPELSRNLGRAVGEFKAQTDQMRSVLVFDPPAAVAAPAPAPGLGVGTERDLQAALHTDERVLGLQAWTAPAPLDATISTVADSATIVEPAAS